MNLNNMKKLIAILFILFSVTAYSQIKVFTVDVRDYFTLDGDSLTTTTQVDSNDTIMATKQFVINTAGAGNGWDSLVWNSNTGHIIWYYAGSTIDSMNIDDRFVEISDSALYATAYSLNYYVDSLSTLFSGAVQYVYEVNLPSSTTVAGRIALATAGTDYPAGWTIGTGDYAVDLKITHGLGRRVSSVSVFAKTGAQERQLFGNAAYSGIYTQSDNILVIESLATIQKDIVIYIIFK